MVLGHYGFQISATQTVLQEQHQSIVGFNVSFLVLTKESVQILSLNKCWICISTVGCSPGHFNVYAYDSFYAKPCHDQTNMQPAQATTTYLYSPLGECSAAEKEEVTVDCLQ